MSKGQTINVPLEQISVTRKARSSIVLVGNPNCGKSTLFNRLTGLRQKTGNYPGVTVEKHVGDMRLGEETLELIDLPGTYALSTDSIDERIVVDVLLGRISGMPEPSAILAVVDATRLYQGLYLLQQLVEMGLPIIVAMTMNDVARMQGMDIDTEALGKLLGGVVVCPIVAKTGRGMKRLQAELASIADMQPPRPPPFWPALTNAADQARQMLQLDEAVPRGEIERALIDVHRGANSPLLDDLDAAGSQKLATLAHELFGMEPALAEEARQRYRWVRQALTEVQTSAPPAARLSARVVDFFNQPLPAMLMFFLVLALVFQAVFAWATPLMDVIDAGTRWLSGMVAAQLPDGALASLITDGVIAGVGSVVIFLPQILILFLFVILLEDTGYLARAAFLMDRPMHAVGLSGQSVIPMLSSFACAVPGIMATRVIPNRRDRIATIIAAPFMTCSARLPVYALLIAAFVPAQSIGVFNLRGLILFGLYMLGILGAALTALLLRQSALRGPKPTFVLALPEFRMPNARSVLIQLLDRARVFLRRAGTVIFTVAVIVWALAYFPNSPEIESQHQVARSEAEAGLNGAQLESALQQLEKEAASAQLEQSWLGRAGRVVEPVFRPLGWDWRVSAAVLAGFPAREVVIAVLGTIYAVGEDASESRLADRLNNARWPDGRLVYTLPMVLGLLVFYALCLQCAATLAVIRRETNSWRWPVFAWTYMSSLGYLGALLIYQLGS